MGQCLIRHGGGGSIDYTPYVQLAKCTTQGGSLEFNSYETELLIVKATSKSGAVSSGGTVTKPTVSISVASGTCTEVFSSTASNGMTNCGWWEVWNYYYGTMYIFMYKVPKNVQITLKIPSFFFAAYGQRILAIS